MKKKLNLRQEQKSGKNMKRLLRKKMKKGSKRRYSEISVCERDS